MTDVLKLGLKKCDGAGGRGYVEQQISFLCGPVDDWFLLSQHLCIVVHGPESWKSLTDRSCF